MILGFSCRFSTCQFLQIIPYTVDHALLHVHNHMNAQIYRLRSRTEIARKISKMSHEPQSQLVWFGWYF